MLEKYGFWMDSIVDDTRRHPQGFVLNPRGWYTLAEQAARRRAAYVLQRRKKITLIQSKKKGSTRPIIVLPYTQVVVDSVNATEGVYDDIRSELRGLLDKHSFIAWVVTGHKTRLQRADNGKPITLVAIASRLGVTQPRVSQLLKEYAEEQAENIKLYSSLLERQQQTAEQ